MGWTKQSPSSRGGRKREELEVCTQLPEAEVRPSRPKRPLTHAVHVHVPCRGLPGSTDQKGGGGQGAGLLMIAAICRRLTPPPPNRPGVQFFFLLVPSASRARNHRTEILPCTLPCLPAAGAANCLICKGIHCLSQPADDSTTAVFYTHLPTPFSRAGLSALLHTCYYDYWLTILANLVLFPEFYPWTCCCSGCYLLHTIAVAAAAAAVSLAVPPERLLTLPSDSLFDLGGDSVPFPPSPDPPRRRWEKGLRLSCIPYLPLALPTQPGPAKRT